MPYALSERQKEYLEFIQEYIRDNEMSPGLGEIARHFGVKPPTAHKILEALQTKGFIYFTRSRDAGFFIRLVERAGLQEVVVEVPAFGKVNQLGEVYDFPNKDLGGFPDFFYGATAYSIFSVILTENIPQANMRAGDIVVVDSSKKPQPGDICIAPMRQKLFLIKVIAKTMDKGLMFPESAIYYPVPADLVDTGLEQRLFWFPVAYDENTKAMFTSISEEQNWPEAPFPLPPNFIMATALHLWRPLAVGG